MSETESFEPEFTNTSELKENLEEWQERPRKEMKEQDLMPLYYGLTPDNWSKLINDGVLETEEYNGVKAAGMMGTPPLLPGQIFKGTISEGDKKIAIVIEVKKVLQRGRTISHRDKIKLTLEITSRTPIENK